MKKNYIIKSLNIILLAAFCWISLSIWKLSEKGMSSSSLLNSLDLCFKRSSQSLTASVIGEMASPYLKTSFLKQTENCYLDFNLAYTALKKEFSIKNVSTKKIDISQSVVAFNESLKIYFKNKNPIISSVNLNDVFASIENDKFSLEQNIKKVIVSTQKNRSQSQIIFYFLLTFMSVNSIVLLFRKNDVKIKRIEPDSKKNTDIEKDNNLDVYQDIPNKKLEDVNVVNLSEIFLQYFDQHASFFLDSNIVLDVKIENNIKILFNPSIINNVIFQSLDFLSSHIAREKSIESNKLIIKTKTLGGSVVLQISFEIPSLSLDINSNINFISDLQKTLKEFSSEVKDISRHTSLTTSKVSATSIGFQFVFLRYKDKRLTSITKGKKKDILKSFNKVYREV